MNTPLIRVIIFAADVQKCAHFYRDIFGFTLLPGSHPPAEWLELETGGCRLAFHQAYGADGPITSPTGSPMNPHKIAFFTQDVEAKRAELVARGVDLDPVHTSGSLSLCNGRDPEGHIFQLSNRP
jgi:catechol 2,3-dioxygenase-like lactoylglutathione lyase family enzyme